MHAACEKVEKRSSSAHDSKSVLTGSTLCPNLETTVYPPERGTFDHCVGFHLSEVPSLDQTSHIMSAYPWKVATLSSYEVPPGVMSLNRLPDELILHIFHQLKSPTPGRIGTQSSRSSSFFRISQHSTYQYIRDLHARPYLDIFRSFSPAPPSSKNPTPHRHIPFRVYKA